MNWSISQSLLTLTALSASGITEPFPFSKFVVPRERLYSGAVLHNPVLRYGLSV